MLTYGVNLPSSLTKSDSFTLVYSTSLPVAVYGTVNTISRIEDFPVERIVIIVFSLRKKLFVTAQVHPAIGGKRVAGFA